MIYRDDVADMFAQIYRKVKEKEFLQMSSLNGEIPFWIVSYNPEQELEIVRAYGGLLNKLEREGIEVLDINLYKIAIEILEANIGLQEMFDIEKGMSKQQFKEAIQSVLDIHEVLMPHLKRLIESSKAQIYFISGVGNVFPYLRSHNILNNLQNIAKEAPTVMFFPGKYTGRNLQLFGLLTDDNYYRASKLYPQK
ncbi:MAG: DUF1788 domain-containing protein [Bacteroidales bacterium]